MPSRPRLGPSPGEARCVHAHATARLRLRAWVRARSGCRTRPLWGGPGRRQAPVRPSRAGRLGVPEDECFPGQGQGRARNGGGAPGAQRSSFEACEGFGVMGFWARGGVTRPVRELAPSSRPQLLSYPWCGESASLPCEIRVKTASPPWGCGAGGCGRATQAPPPAPSSGPSGGGGPFSLLLGRPPATAPVPRQGRKGRGLPEGPGQKACDAVGLSGLPPASALWWHLPALPLPLC